MQTYIYTYITCMYSYIYIYVYKCISIYTYSVPKHTQGKELKTKNFYLIKISELVNNNNNFFFQNALLFYGTCVNVILRSSFLVPIFTRLANAQRVYAHIPLTKFHPNRKINTGSTDRNPLRLQLVWLSVSQFL
jgi:hypothetical protein